MKKDAQFEVGNLRFNGMKPRARITARKFSSLIFFCQIIFIPLGQGRFSSVFFLGSGQELCPGKFGTM